MLTLYQGLVATIREQHIWERSLPTMVKKEDCRFVMVSELGAMPQQCLLWENTLNTLHTCSPFSSFILHGKTLYFGFPSSPNLCSQAALSILSVICFFFIGLLILLMIAWSSVFALCVPTYPASHPSHLRKSHQKNYLSRLRGGTQEYKSYYKLRFQLSQYSLIKHTHINLAWFLVVCLNLHQNIKVCSSLKTTQA